MSELPWEVDVLVIGAGPAGAVCARVLAAAGHKVMLLDRVQEVGVAGQCLAANARGLLQSLDLLPWLERSAPQTISSGFAAWGSEDLQVCQFMHSAYCGGWYIDRRRFDSCLRAAAMEAGAQLHLARLTKITRENGRWICHLKGEQRHALHSVASTWLVDASGRRAISAQFLGIPKCNDESLVALFASGKNRSTDQRSVIEAAPYGWWYSALLPGEKRIAALHLDAAEAGQMLRHPGLWLEKLQATHYISRVCQPDANWSAPHACEASGAVLRECHAEHWLALGDAALCYDPLATQGIFAALESGSLGAQSILQAIKDGQTSLDGYAAIMRGKREEYRDMILRHYLREQRWPRQHFWAVRHKAAQALGIEVAGF